MPLRKFSFALLAVVVLATSALAQPDRWQQAIDYQMEIDFDVETHRFSGVQRIRYTNNSPDVLPRVFFHLYFNAFQPNSMMDMRSRTIPDPDPRVGSRIAGLSEEEIGYHRVRTLSVNGQAATFETVGTVLEVTLPEPIQPGAEATFELTFDAQVPVQIRRSGRDNAEGIDYSMAQWYPKMAEYDYQGWHANPYVGREFYGVWGDFDVRINIDPAYVVAATGYLQNPEAIGHGYTEAPVTDPVLTDDGKLSWHFVAPSVHDFVWAADPDYRHTTLTRDNGMVIHCFFQETEGYTPYWEQLPEIMDAAFGFINENYGEYPYDQYSFIQGGDGGMEYPMATLITGQRSLSSLIGVSVHELMHSWYQMVLGTNESLYAWMDEGFTEYATNEVENFLRREGLMPGEPREHPHLAAVNSYLRFAQTGLEEPLSIHADHFFTNSAYGRGAYTKGEVFLTQLHYVIGQEAFDRGMLDYFETWKFKHPNPNDFIRVMERVSGFELDWFKEYWVYTTRTVDYAIGEVAAGTDGGTSIILQRLGQTPMPVDLEIEYTDGSRARMTIPLRIMRGEKAEDAYYDPAELEVLPDWPWTHPTYTLALDRPPEAIQKVSIDPSMRLADDNRENNIFNPASGGE